MQKAYKFTLCDVQTDLDYLVSIPEGFDKTKEKLPLIVFLHGAGERGDDIELVKVHGIPKIFDKESPYRVITLSPQCKEGRVWATQVYALKALIDKIAEEFNVDLDRITITGISMGGYGTWEMGMTFPGFFAAMAPICGGGTPWRAGYLIDTPIRVYHGEADGVVPLTQSLDMCNGIKAAGGTKLELTTYPGVDHNCWDKAYGETDLIKWLAEAKKA